MRHLLYVALGLPLLGPSARAFAQDTANMLGRCTAPDSVAVIGNRRVTDADVRAASGLVPGVPANAKTAQDAVKNLFETGQFDDVRVTCTVPKGGQHAVWTVTVSERPLLEITRVVGTDKLSQKTVRGPDRCDARPSTPGRGRHPRSHADRLRLPERRVLPRQGDRRFVDRRRTNDADHFTSAKAIASRSPACGFTATTCCPMRTSYAR